MTSKESTTNIKKEIDDTNSKLNLVNVRIFPHDYLISTSSQCFYEHLVTNVSPFAIACRVRATSPTYFRIANNSFVLQAGEACQLVIERLPRAIKSHRITIEAIPHITSQPIENLHYFFEIHPFPRQFHVRYHQLPTWHATSQRMTQRRDIAAEHPKVLELCQKTGIMSVREQQMSLNQYNILEMAISSDTDSVKK